MSQAPASLSLAWTRGATVEEEFIYRDDDGTPVDLTGFEARMQIRTLAGQYGTSTADTLVLELDTTGVDPLMYFDTAAEGRLRIKARPDQHAALNPGNAKKTKYVYSLELYRADGSGEYVIPLFAGKITVRGETTR